jgi:hypothetical protein
MLAQNSQETCLARKRQMDPVIQAGILIRIRSQFEE